MIFYFSATGNSKYVAQKLAKETEDRIISITECLKNSNYQYEIQSNEKIGFVTPTYFGGLPSVVVDFMEKLELKVAGNHYVYHVVTYGAFYGKAHAMIENALKKKGMILNGKFIIQMVDTWTPVFDLTDEKIIHKYTQAAEAKIPEIVQKVKNEVAGNFTERRVPPLVFAIAYSFYKSAQKTKKFKLEDSCVGCGLCAKNCPVDAIEIQGEKPVWIKDRCTLCMGCLHHCPKFAIQYGKHTREHGQFVNPNVKL